MLTVHTNRHYTALLSFSTHTVYSSISPTAIQTSRSSSSVSFHTMSPAFLPPMPLSSSPSSFRSFSSSTSLSLMHKPVMISFPSFPNPWSNKTPTKPALNLTVGYSYLAHPEKNTGEDAFFVEGNCAGVFDGVSGAYEAMGVDPRLYSQTLAALTREKVQEYGAESVVKAAIDASLENTTIGASTACVVGMDRVGRLFGINLGDSGVRIVRDGKVIWRTKEQQHFFNCPYQLGSDSEDGLAMGQNVQRRVRADDVIVVATDGLYDNVMDGEIARVLNTQTDMMTAADMLGELASQRGMDKSFVSPFMQAAIKAGQQWQGGKADDITVVLLKVVEGDVQPEALISTLPEMDIPVPPADDQQTQAVAEQTEAEMDKEEEGEEGTRVAGNA